MLGVDICFYCRYLTLSLIPLGPEKMVFTYQLFAGIDKELKEGALFGT